MKSLAEVAMEAVAPLLALMIVCAWAGLWAAFAPFRFLDVYRLWRSYKIPRLASFSRAVVTAVTWPLFGR